MQAQSRLITKRFNGHSDRSQSRRCRPLGLPEVGGPGSDADVYLMSWNLVYIEKSACLQDTTSVSPSPSFSCCCDVVQGSLRSPGMACDITRAMPSPDGPIWGTHQLAAWPPGWSASAGLAVPTGRVSEARGGSEVPSAWGRHRSGRAGGLAQPPHGCRPSGQDAGAPCCAVGAEAERGPRVCQCPR